MTVIWKYQLSDIGEQRITVSPDYTIIAANSQDGDLCLWVVVDPTNLTTDLTIRMYSTGGHIDMLNQVHIATVQYYDGTIHVRHIFRQTT